MRASARVPCQPIVRRFDARVPVMFASIADSDVGMVDDRLIVAPLPMTALEPPITDNPDPTVKLPTKNGRSDAEIKSRKGAEDTVPLPCEKKNFLVADVFPSKAIGPATP